MNNPIIFIDPDGKDVYIYHMSKERMAALDAFLSTESGREYVSRFLKQGEMIKLVHSSGKVEDYGSIVGTGDHDYQYSRLEFGANNKMREGHHGTSLAFVLNKDGSIGSRLNSGKIVVDDNILGELNTSKNFLLKVIVNGVENRSIEDIAKTFGHEIFVHQVNNSETIQNVIDLLKSGKYDKDELKDMLNKEGVNGTTEDDAAKKGFDEDFNKFLKELIDFSIKGVGNE